MNHFQKLLPIFLVLFCLIPGILNAQVGVNATGSDPDASAMLDVSSTDKGMLIPRMTASERDLISSPADGLMVYVTDDSSFYYYDGLAWAQIAGEETGFSLQDIQVTDSLTYNGQTYLWQEFLELAIEDNDQDSTNEIQNLALSGTTLSISDGNNVDLSTVQDNLGNHTATQNIRLNGRWLSNDGGNEGIYVDANGNVGINTNNPQAKLDIRNVLRYVDGREGADKVLVSDANGVAKWGSPGYGREVLECYTYSFANPQVVVSQLQQQSGYFLVSFANGILWQSFTAVEGYLTSVEIWTKTSSNQHFKGGFLNIYQGEGNGGTRLLRKSVGSISGNGTVDVSADNIFLTEGVKYTIEFVDSNGAWGWAASDFGGGGPYSGGRSSTNGNRDHKFRVSMAVCEDRILQAMTVNEARGTNIMNNIDTIYFADGTFQASRPHDMRQNVEMNGNWISHDGDNEGIMVDASGRIGIGTAPSQTLDINGSMRIRGGSPGQNKVLVSDNNGFATWQRLSIHTENNTVQTFNNSDSWRNLTNGISFSDWATNDQVKIEAVMTLRLTGGSNTDDFDIRVELNYNGCGSTSGIYSNTMTYRPAERLEEHDNHIIVPYLDVATLNGCGGSFSGNLTFTLQVRNTGDDGWEASEVFLMITKL